MAEGESMPSEVVVAAEGSPRDEDMVAVVVGAGDDKETEKGKENGDKLATAATLKHARDDGNIPFWKTSLCSYFRSNSGKCNHGDNCRYAHGEEELRPRPDSTWDPTSERVKKMPKTAKEEEGDDGNCCDDDGDQFLGLSDDTEKCLIGLPRNWDTEKLKVFLDQHGILYRIAKKKKSMTVGFLTFSDVQQLHTALQDLKGKQIGGKCIKVADAVPRSSTNKQTPKSAIEWVYSGKDDTASESGNITDDNSFNAEGLVIKGRNARDAVTPLAHLPYSEQLEYKKKSLLHCLKKLTRNARKACPDSVPYPDWIQNAREIGGLSCELEGIIQSPLTTGYRNKCEFSVGYSVDGKKTVGFNLGNFREGMVAVEEPTDCPNISSISRQYALIFQEFLHFSKLPLWNRINNNGFWRQFTVREGRNPVKGDGNESKDVKIAEVMLIIQICSSGVDDDVMKAEFERLTSTLVEKASATSPPLPLSALVIQDHKGISNAASADCPLFPLPVQKIGEDSGISGSPNQVVIEERIHDSICNLRFCISPTAFFQVNTLAAEKLYSLAGDWARLSPDTLLFDICCGTGTIGLTLAHRVGMVVGIEMNSSAVSDAFRNADINGIKNCKFICSKAEDVIETLLKEYIVNVQQCEIPRSDSVDTTDMKNPDTNETFESCGNNTTVVSEATTDGNATLASVTTSTESGGQKEVSVVCNHEIIHDTTYMKNPDTNETFESCGNNTTVVSEATTDGNAMLVSVATSTESGGQKEVSVVCNHEIIHDNASPSVENHDKPSQDDKDKEENGTSMPHFKDVVAIVDPPRAGLHPKVIKALRTNPRLQRFVYISCNPESLMANAIELCTPTADNPQKGGRNARGRTNRNISSAGLARHRSKSMPMSKPYRPVKAMAVDLFPHTAHCEMVMLFER